MDDIRPDAFGEALKTALMTPTERRYFTRYRQLEVAGWRYGPDDRWRHENPRTKVSQIAGEEAMNMPEDAWLHLWKTVI